MGKYNFLWINSGATSLFGWCIETVFYELWFLTDDVFLNFRTGDKIAVLCKYYFLCVCNSKVLVLIVLGFLNFRTGDK